MKICPEGWPFIIPCDVVAMLLLAAAFIFHSPVLGAFAGLGFVVTAFVLYFFRSPARIIPNDDSLILSPADGRIMEIIEGTDASATGPVWILRIFLSVFEPHLQRASVRGTVRSVTYTKGKFLDARDPKAAFENEQNRMEIQSANPALTSPVVITQIAGLIARRIICDVKSGQTIAAGDRLGLIRFGSQVDMVLPHAVRLKVKMGDHVTAGDTVIAEV